MQPAPLPFALRDVHPDGMLVAGDSIMQGDPEGPARTLRERREKGEHLVDALVVTGDRVAARLVEDRIVGEQLPKRLDVASREGVVGSTNQVLVGMGHGHYLLSAEAATLFLPWRTEASTLSPPALGQRPCSTWSYLNGRLS
jgi:hypothetical protein